MDPTEPTPTISRKVRGGTKCLPDIQATRTAPCIDLGRYLYTHPQVPRSGCAHPSKSSSRTLATLTRVLYPNAGVACQGRITLFYQHSKSSASTVLGEWIPMPGPICVNRVRDFDVSSLGRHDTNDPAAAAAAAAQIKIKSGFLVPPAPRTDRICGCTREIDRYPLATSISNLRVCESSPRTKAIRLHVRCITRAVKAAPAPGAVAACP